MEKNWKAYYERTKDSPPSPLLVKALPFVPKIGRALDIGGGALKDTRFLLEKGYEVTVIDKDEALTDIVRNLGNPDLRFAVTSFEDFPFPKDACVLANANNALPFATPGTLDAVFGSIKESLVADGIFCDSSSALDTDGPQVRK